MDERIIERFHKKFASYGGASDPEWVTEADRKVLSWIVHSDYFPVKVKANDYFSSIDPNLPRDERLYISYINNWSFNSVTKTDQHLYYIGIPIGIPFIAFNMFSILLRCPEIFTEIGLPSTDDWDEKYTYHFIANTCKNLREDPQGRPILQPNLPSGGMDDRQTFSTHLAWIAVNFIGMHERMHVFRGHLDYLNSKANSNELTPEDQRSLEIDADIRASHLVNDDFRERMQEKAPYPILCEPEGLIEVLTFAYGILFHFLAEFQPIPSSPFKPNHPNERIRANLIISEYIQTLVSKDIIDMEKAEKGRLKGVENLDNICNAIKAPVHPFSKRGFSKQEIDDEAEGLLKMLDNFNSILPELNLGF